MKIANVTLNGHDAVIIDDNAIAPTPYKIQVKTEVPHKIHPTH